METTGLEPLSYQWWKGAQPIPNANSRILELPVTASADAGNYAVVVSNGDGSVTSTCDQLGGGRHLLRQVGVVAASDGRQRGAGTQRRLHADGIVNFLDFAFGVQPGLESGVGAQPRVSRDALGYLLAYREANGILPLTYRIWKSADISAWVEHLPALGEVTRIDRGSYSEVQVRVPPPNPRLFFKMEVSF